MYADVYKCVKTKENALILAIESSCDETAAAVVRGGREILSNEIMSSCSEHVRFGGVVPEIASRAHTTAISLVTKAALDKAGVTLKDLNAIAVTYGAGLLGALLVGVSYAKSLAYASDLPLVPVSHIRGHIAACYLNNPELEPPFISLLASGGHTAVLYVKSYTEFEIVGQTLDDAVGEAFDKVARVLNLEYPGGPNIERLAVSGKPSVELPKMFKGDKKNFNFTYSGLKTAVINYTHNCNQAGIPFDPADVACSFQRAALDVLVEKTVSAAKVKSVKTISAGGGVVANGYLRCELEKACKTRKIKLFLPPKPLCTDNAAMIGAEGYIQYMHGNFAALDLNAQASVEL
ncbi:MAG: tRNA (adenosine(37)-N6)-threonylcarbamoyltransferase complex transferase subunit TsaD [Clostridia bacterium]|nr:tRNA (adenosine(37)-N6)-threonylcarbamoyltransferase complex transferase subunit TsaD [Clostridia bacterium]